MFNWLFRTQKEEESSLDLQDENLMEKVAEVIEFVDGTYGIRRNNSSVVRNVEFLDLKSAVDGREYWWGLDSQSYEGNCASSDLLKVRKIFLEKPYTRLADERAERDAKAKTADVGYAIDLDIATAEYKLSGQHNELAKY